jgi:hypothetical protein
MKSIDRFQIIGFVLSTIISVVLLIRGQDTVSSIILGLSLAILTQLFDIQLRNTEAESKLLEASLLDSRLFGDTDLLHRIKQIVDDYYMVKEGWFVHFKNIADDSLNVCQFNLHTLANGYIGLPPFNPFAYGAKGFRNIEKCAYTVALGAMEYWRSSTGRKYLKVNDDAIQRGVDITRIFIQWSNHLEQYKDVLVEMSQMGVKLYTISPDDVPVELKRDMNILDEKILVHLELTNDGSVREDIITIDPVKVKRAMDDFEKLKDFATKFSPEIDIVDK